MYNLIDKICGKRMVKHILIYNLLF